ncbi:MAG: HAMP domain-containing histidine kinase [Chloroflexota bacterium]|nr:HAMP domain-containing histidine kinase [Chloroflexota bacterium]
MKSALRTIGRRAVPEFSDACLVDFLDVGGTRLSRALAFPARALSSKRLVEFTCDVADAPAPVAEALQRRKATVHPRVPMAAFAGARGASNHVAALVAPILSRLDVVGAVSFLRRGDRPGYCRSDMAEAAGLARQIGWLVDRQRSDEAIERLVRGQNRLLSSVAHDLRAPLSTIKLRSALLRRAAAKEPLDQERMLAGLGDIEESVKRASQLIDELLDLSRAGNGQPLVLECEADDMVRLARQAANERISNGDDVEVTVDSTAPEISGTWDRRRIGRVLDRIIGGAMAASPRGGLVKVHVSKIPGDRGASVAVSVRHRSAAGFEEELAQLLEGHWTAGCGPESRTENGLGLASAHHVVKAHGGELEAGCGPDGETQVTLRLPLAGP